MKSKKQNNNGNKDKKKLPNNAVIGGLDLTFTLNLKEDELEGFNVKFEDLNSFSDLAPMLNDPKMVDRIELSSANTMITSLIYLNKCYKTNVFVEYVHLDKINLDEADEYFRDIIKKVTERNLLFFNEIEGKALGDAKLKFELKVGENVKSYSIKSKHGNNNHHDKDHDSPKQMEQNSKHEEVLAANPPYNDDEFEGNENENLNNVEDDVNINVSGENRKDNQSKQGTQKVEETTNQKDDIHSVNNQSEQSKHKKNFFYSNISSAFNQINYLFIDLQTVLQLTSTHSNFPEFIEFLQYLLKKFKHLQLIVLYPNITGNSKLIDLDILENIETLLSLTDLAIFEKKEALALFNMIHQIHSEEENPEDLTKTGDKYLDTIFLNSFIKKRHSFNKKALFIDELIKLTIIETKPDNSAVIYNNNYDFQLYPKINHTNQKLVDEYKKHAALNYNSLKAIFIGAFMYKYIFNKSYYTAFVAGEQVARRVLEIYRNGWPLPNDKDFYYVIIDKSMVEEQVKREVLQKKEQKFVLDCININNSKLRDYNPLYDSHLSYFFSSNLIKRNLKEAGFINTRGIILPNNERRSPERINKVSKYESKVLSNLKESQGSNDRREKTKRSIERVSETKTLPSIMTKRLNANQNL